VAKGDEGDSDDSDEAYIVISPKEGNTLYYAMPQQPWIYAICRIK